MVLQSPYMHTIHMISGPRNMSTALMYAFAQHPEIATIDEPFYACYLHQTKKQHPGFDAVLQSQPAHWQEVVQNLENQKAKRLFIKNMAHHLGCLPDLSWMQNHRVIHLVREPAKMIHSFSKVIAQPTLQDLGLEDQFQLHQKLKAMGVPQTTVVSEDFLAHPETGLRELCDFLALPFTEKMLSWPAGPKAYDGVWAPFWYHEVHQTTGFAQQPTTATKVPHELVDLYHQADYFYQQLIPQTKR